MKVTEEKEKELYMYVNMSVGQMNKSASENVSQESVPPLSLFSSKDIYIVRANQNQGRNHMVKI